VGLRIIDLINGRRFEERLEEKIRENNEVLKAFGAYTPNFADHPPLVLVGDAKTGQWLRFYGFPSAEQLVKAVAELTAARGKAGAAG
jgi:protein SCO1/2